MTIIELAEHLTALGWSCEIRAAVVGAPLGMIAFEHRIEVSPIQPLMDVSSFDLVWCQHGTLANIDFSALTQSRKTLIVSAHLSPYTNLERVLHPLENELCDIIAVNSNETRSSLPQWINSEKVVVTNNPAPASFFTNRSYNSTVRNVLCVSNHIPHELSHVLLHFMRDLMINVTTIGAKYTYARTTPRHIADCDLVISIGKTVQYALASRTPTYVYDHFGGDGWITSRNIDTMSDYNFSGRPSCRKLTSAAILKELLGDYQYAINEINDIPHNKINRYHIDTLISLITHNVTPLHPIQVHAVDARILETTNLQIQLIHQMYKYKYPDEHNSIWCSPSIDQYYR